MGNSILPAPVQTDPVQSDEEVFDGSEVDILPPPSGNIVYTDNYYVDDEKEISVSSGSLTPPLSPPTHDRSFHTEDSSYQSDGEDD
jgi:hypothetical protein